MKTLIIIISGLLIMSCAPMTASERMAYYESKASKPKIERTYERVYDRGWNHTQTIVKERKVK